MPDESWSALEVYSLKLAVDSQLNELEDVRILAAFAREPLPIDILQLVAALRSSQKRLEAITEAWASMAEEESLCP